MNKHFWYKTFTTGSVIFLFLLAIDFSIELFQINESGTVVTLFGVKIVTIMTKQELSNSLTLTYTTLISYLLTLLVWSVIRFIISQRKEKT
ncbi:hypothetical protein [Ligilactobacillus apodemi]|uniref:hypothetical protein n=1 Tax=Ligilactobacillus apodemi TaxID=307126 RepID=UPI00214B779F|nr:hypothetical protein [Ligilactobacillus apodemi]MCR1901388.1 hypothetical protein [Ligilactobacillus apodemi]